MRKKLESELEQARKREEKYVGQNFETQFVYCLYQMIKPFTHEEAAAKLGITVERLENTLAGKGKAIMLREAARWACRLGYRLEITAKREDNGRDKQ
ncbi:MAG: hypothetical protein PHS46_08060 [Candidatus Omnitrophica bacterium]|nr:hypothetical protein [Candidatus Omnitrophota bacterium]